MKIDIEAKDSAGNHRIFLIDPDVINRSPLYFMLADNETYELDSVADIADMDRRLVPDLVIVNALLVAAYGKALISGWRSAWPRVRVLVICEACDAECVRAAKAAGADDTLLRPFKREVVRRKVGQWTEGLIELSIPAERKDSPLHVAH